MNEIRNHIKDQLADTERILIGLGAEWKLADEEREAVVGRAAENLKALVDGRDYFVISTLPKEQLDRFGFYDLRTVAPLDEALTEERWNLYTEWLSRTLNRKLVILELGEGFKYPQIMRWPFEKTAAVNNKAHLFRVHKTFHQIPDEAAEKATAVKADSAEFFAEIL